MSQLRGLFAPFEQSFGAFYFILLQLSKEKIIFAI